MKKIYIIVGLLFGSVVRADFLDMLGFETAKIDVVLGEQKEERVRKLKQQVEECQNQDQKENVEFEAKSDQIKTKIAHIESSIASGKADSTAQQKLMLLQTSYQTITNIKTAKKELIDTYQQHIALLENIIQEEIKVTFDQEKKVYSVEDLQNINRSIISQDDRIESLNSSRNVVVADLQNSQKQVDISKKLYDQKIYDEEITRKKIYSNNESAHILDVLVLEAQLAKYEHQYAVEKVKEKTARLEFLTEALAIENKKLQKIKQKRDQVISRSLCVDQVDIDQARQKLTKYKHNYLVISDKYLQKIEYLTHQQEELKKELHVLESYYGNTAIEAQSLTTWTFSPATIQSYRAFVDCGVKRLEIALVEGQIEFERASIELEKTKFKEFELNYKIIQAWYNIKHQTFTSSDKLFKAIEEYRDIMGECNREKSIDDDKRHALINRLNLHNRSLSNIKTRIEELKTKNHYMFRKNGEDFEYCLEQFQRAHLLLLRQIELTGHLIESYSNTLVILNGYEKQLSNTIVELQRASLWQRSGGAISREGLHNIIPDIYYFFSDIFTLRLAHTSQDSIKLLLQKIIGLLYEPYWILFALLKLLLCIFIFMCVRRYSLIIAEKCLEIEPEYRGAYFFSRLGAVTLQFVHAHQWSLTVWLTCFYGIISFPNIDIFVTVLFYLLSIIYAVIMIHTFIRFVLLFNRNHDYQLFSEHFEDRFIFSIGTFLYASAIILFFREAFVTATYMKSELPGILLAFYSIIVRVLLLSLLRKEDLISFFSQKTFIGSWISHIIESYYYGLLGTIVLVMVLSDPHIGGYDNLIAYLFWGIVGTLIIIRILFLLYSFVRRISSHLFFTFDDESMTERFDYAKTWYGASVIITFLFFIILGAILVAWCWGKSIQIHTIFDFFSMKRLGIGFKDGQYQQVSIIDLIRTCLFIPGGFLVAYLVDKFVLHRIYMLLLVNPGVHNAVSTISYYVVVISVITLGLIHEGFGFLVTYYILPILVGMAWAIRDVFNDFVAYFVLLIQRPIKVGDFIRISSEVEGVVRKITPRTVILRRQQSYHLIIPNSKMMQDVIYNWDYTRSFIAFPDIHVGVRYATDPELVKKLLFQAVDSVLNVLKIPAPVIRLEEFGPSGYIFLVRGFISSEMTLEQWNIASDVRLSIVRTLHKHSIELAYPVRIIKTVVHGSDQQYLEPLSGSPENNK